MCHRIEDIGSGLGWSEEPRDDAVAHGLQATASRPLGAGAAQGSLGRTSDAGHKSLAFVMFQCVARMGALVRVSFFPRWLVTPRKAVLEVALDDTGHLVAPQALPTV